MQINFSWHKRNRLKESKIYIILLYLTAAGYTGTGVIYINHYITENFAHLLIIVIVVGQKVGWLLLFILFCCFMIMLMMVDFFAIRWNAITSSTFFAYWKIHDAIDEFYFVGTVGRWTMEWCKMNRRNTCTANTFNRHTNNEFEWASSI